MSNVLERATEYLSSAWVLMTPAGTVERRDYGKTTAGFVRPDGSWSLRYRVAGEAVEVEGFSSERAGAKASCDHEAWLNVGEPLLRELCSNLSLWQEIAQTELTRTQLLPMKLMGDNMAWLRTQGVRLTIESGVAEGHAAAAKNYDELTAKVQTLRAQVESVVSLPPTVDMNTARELAELRAENQQLRARSARFEAFFKAHEDASGLRTRMEHRAAPLRELPAREAAAKRG